MDHQVIAFTGLAAILTLIPGSDTMLVVRNVLARGKACGFLTTAGICTGLFVHAVLSAAGVSVILLKSAVAFHVLKTAGACYLMYLGIKTIIEVRRTPHEFPVGNDRHRLPDSEKNDKRHAFMEGMLNNVLNPKTAVFYLAVLPQFITPGDSVFVTSILLTAIHYVMAMIWLSALTCFLGYAGSFMTGTRFRNWIQTSGGLILVALGLRLAVERR